MNPYLRHSLYWLSIAVAFVWLWLSLGCAAIVQPDGWQHFCVPNAIRDAWTYEVKTGLPSRIALSHVKPGIDHAQAQGQAKDGNWKYLATMNDALYFSDRHFKNEPFRVVSLNEFIKEQGR